MWSWGQDHCCCSWVWGEVDFFVSWACANSATERNAVLMRHHKQLSPGLGLGWPCAFGLSTTERVIERVYYLLCGVVSSKVIKYALGDLLSSWQEYLGQTLFIDIAVLANTLCKLAYQTPFISQSGQNGKICCQKPAGLLMNRIPQIHDANCCTGWEQSPPQADLSGKMYLSPISMQY